jgi:hypothetical protein
MFSQKEVNSPLAEKRIVYSLLRRGIFGRRCYSESTPVTHKHRGLTVVQNVPVQALELNVPKAPLNAH